MNKTALIIGYGSIGERHAKLLKKFKNISKIYILTKRICNNFNKIKSISEIKKINPDYIVISSRTSDHFKHLSYVEKHLKNARTFSREIIVNQIVRELINLMVIDVINTTNKKLKKVKPKSIEDIYKQDQLIVDF